MRRIDDGHVFWLTGLSGAGKSTLAQLLEEQMIVEGLPVVCLDGDQVRLGLSSDLGFSREDRKENIRRIGEMAKLLADSGIIVVVSAISPFEADRSQARSIIGPARFSEVFVSCPLNVCVERDVKALYRRAAAGAIAQFTGISSPYEEPVQPALVLQTDSLSKVECMEALMKLVHSRLAASD